VTLSVQSFVALWNTYLWPLLVTNKTEMRTVQVGITMLTTLNDTNYSLVMAAVAIVLIPSFILFIMLRRNITEGISTGALVG
jgi:sn-glycerol 3-phosphate transport system permease protein